ncbi:MAG: tetratricopeptide repeat protein [Candidatus Omnitrophica bacterium]|nr:tetratricopeptide repeat protein [Candidatus Omnitrophota bacterium]
MKIKKELAVNALFLVMVIFGGFFITKKTAFFFARQALKKQNQGDFSAAEPLYLRSLKLFPIAEAYFNLGCIYKDRGDFDQAVAQYKQALKMAPGNEGAYEELISIYEENGDAQTAQAYRQMQERNCKITFDNGTNSGEADKQEQAIILYNEAVKFLEAGIVEQALDNLNKAIALQSLFWQAYSLSADCYIRQNRLKEALNSYNNILRLSPQDADMARIYSNMGFICMCFEQYGRAIQYFQAAYDLEPDNIDIAYSLASVLRDNQQAGLALEFFKRIEVKAPDYPGLHNDLGEIYLLSGETESAQYEFHKEIEQVNKDISEKKENPLNRLRMAKAYSGLGEDEKALEYINAVIQERPNYQQAYYVRAQIKRKLGLQKEAEDDLENAKTIPATQRIIPAGGKIIRRADIKKIVSENIKQVRQTAKPLFLDKEDIIIYLKNGYTVRGKLKKETDTVITIDIPTGGSYGTVSFSKKKIEKIQKIN